MNALIELAPIFRADLSQMLTWRNDWRIIAWTRQNDLIDELHHESWFERQSKDPTIKMYKVINKSGGETKFSGVVGLTSIDWQNRRAEFSLYLGPEYQRLGIGPVALKVILAHGFVNLGLNVIWGETFEGNPAAPMFESVGMTKEGARRQFYWKDGKYIDAHLYSITSEEWRELSKPKSVPDSGGACPPAPGNLRAVPGGVDPVAKTIDVEAGSERPIGPDASPQPKSTRKAKTDRPQ